jgi:hypothetical protein
LKHYAFGALIMQYQRRGQFVREFRELLQGCNWGEVKWNKLSDHKLAHYKRIVDHFFRTSWLYFHCIVVQRAWVQARTYHKGSYDLARRKHFTQFLANKVDRITRLDPKREYEFRVYVDRIASSYKRADEAMYIIGNNLVSHARSERGLVDAAKKSPIENVIEVDSKDRPEIQLCDLLLGAVTDTWNGASTSKAKAQVKAHIATYIGWNDLRHATYARERKFNVWWLTDKFRSETQRPVRAEPVRLLYPLPLPRVYRRRA